MMLLEILNNIGYRFDTNQFRVVSFSLKLTLKGQDEFKKLD